MDNLYTVSEVADKLKISDKTLRRWEDAGRFHPSRTLGNQRRYSLSDIQILDAIKHNVISDQASLLSLDQAASLMGVSPATIERWEREGKIHPFVTMGATYYPKHRLVDKMTELKADPEILNPPPTFFPSPPPVIERPVTPMKTSPTPLTHPHPSFTLPSSLLTQALLTLILLLLYHLFFNQPPSLPDSPAVPGEIQGTSTLAPDPRIDDLITKFSDHLSAEMLKDAKTVPTTTINLAQTALITGQTTLPQGKAQISVSHPSLTSTTPVTATFTSDYAPAKKFWITVTQGSFTLHTDFPVTADSVFNYSFLSKEATTSGQTTATGL